MPEGADKPASNKRLGEQAKRPIDKNRGEQVGIGATQVVGLPTALLSLCDRVLETALCAFCLLALLWPSPSRATENEEGARVVDLSLVGDVQFGRYKRGSQQLHSADADWSEVSASLGAAQFRLINLETVLSERLPVEGDEGIHLISPPHIASFLAEQGIDVAVLANNHINDAGLDGALDTAAHLEAAGIASVGLAREHGDDPFAPLLIERDGVALAVFAVTTFVSVPLHGRRRYAQAESDQVPKRLHDALRTLREEDPERLLIVSLHWGEEDEFRPNDEQVALARGLIDAGAHLVFGHHAHVLQPAERWGEGAILYSMGNFFFHQDEDFHRRSAIAQLRFVFDGAGWTLDTLRFDCVERVDSMLSSCSEESSEALWQQLAKASKRLRWNMCHANGTQCSY
ncbi:MAG: CapA family protein [Myxococcota bacterium]|nr:CapA family protein [Myxococcota bacterium]